MAFTYSAFDAYIAKSIRAALDMQARRNHFGRPVSDNDYTTLAGVFDTSLTAIATLIGGSDLAVPVASIVVSPSTASVNDGATQQFTVVAIDGLGNVLTGRTVTWASSDASKNTINASTGLATGVGVGNSTITATCEGKTSTAVLTAVDPTKLAASDAFTRADSTSIFGAGDWTMWGSSVGGTSSNRGYPAVGAPFKAVKGKMRNGVLVAIAQSQDWGAVGAGFIFHGVDTNNFMQVQGNNNGGNLQLFSVVAGTAAEITADSTVGALHQINNSGDVGPTITVSSKTVTVAYGGTTVTFTIPDAAYASLAAGAWCGVYATGTSRGTATQFDNYSVTPA